MFILFVLAFFLRFYKISQNPPGLYWDETSIGYNAYSILKSGKDEYGKFLPVSFKAFGEYKLPVYIYFTVFTTAIFGPSEFAVRFPSAACGVLTVVAFYFLVAELFASRRLAFLSSLLLAISPWHLQFSRAGFEANLALFFLILGALLFLKSRYQPILLLASSLFFSLTLYTYSTARLFTPLFILVLLTIWGKKLWLATKARKTLAFFLLPFVAFYLALFLSPHLTTRFTVVSAFHGYSFFQWPAIFLKNYLSHFSFDFLFFKGDGFARHGVEKMGNLYFFEIPFILIGFYQLIKSADKKTKAFVLAWLSLSPLAASLADPSPHSLRSLTMVVPMTIISGFGLFQIISWVGVHFKKAFLQNLIYTTIIAIIVYFFLNYLHLYYVHYPKTSALAWQDGNKEMVEEVLKRKDGYERIYVSDYLGQTYIYFLLYGRIDPDFYQENRTSDGFGKYHFIGKNWPQKLDNDSLWVFSFDDKFIPEGQLLKEIRITNGDMIYNLWGNK